VNEKNCYALEPVLSFDDTDWELEPAAIGAWALRARSVGLRVALPELILKLDRLAKTAMPAPKRVEALQALKRPLLKMVASLPKPASTPPEGASETLMLEQRIYCLTVKNLKQALLDNDGSAESYSAEMDKRRRWTMRNLLRFLGRQIEFAVLWNRTIPSHTWQELHDLHTYATVRGYARPRSRAASLRSSRVSDFAPQREYLRLLLLGLAAHQLGGGRMSPVLVDQIASWAGESRLVEPEAHLGELGLFLVELSVDAPPRQIPGALTDTFRGWILQPAEGFMDYLHREEGGKQGSAVFAGMRSVSGAP
jgi:hypothetical protein